MSESIDTRDPAVVRDALRYAEAITDPIDPRPPAAPRWHLYAALCRERLAEIERGHHRPGPGTGGQMSNEELLLLVAGLTDAFDARGILSSREMPLRGPEEGALEHRARVVRATRIIACRLLAERLDRDDAHQASMRGGEAPVPDVRPGHDGAAVATPRQEIRGLTRHHGEASCRGEYCCIHNPSDHHMREWPLNWRDDTGVMERICPHGVGHPDPDHLAHVSMAYGTDVAETQGIHGCDGCCTTPRQAGNDREGRTPASAESAGAPTEDTFPIALERLLNRYSQENASNTPDFILSQFLGGCLTAWNTAVQQRETWYGRDARPSAGAPTTTDGFGQSAEWAGRVAVEKGVAPFVRSKESLKHSDPDHDVPTMGAGLDGISRWERAADESFDPQLWAWGIHSTDAPPANEALRHGRDALRMTPEERDALELTVITLEHAAESGVLAPTRSVSVLRTYLERTEGL